MRPFGRLRPEVPALSPERPLPPAIPAVEHLTGPESVDPLYERVRSLRGLLPRHSDPATSENRFGVLDRALWRRYKPRDVLQSEERRDEGAA